jgi:hypothetical protein
MYAVGLKVVGIIVGLAASDKSQSIMLINVVTVVTAESMPWRRHLGCGNFFVDISLARRCLPI